MANHGTRVRRHIERMGPEKVEAFLDTCLSLENLIDPMSPFIARNSGRRGTEPEELPTRALTAGQGLHGGFYQPTGVCCRPAGALGRRKGEKRGFPEQPERDVLMFLLAHAELEDWERDVLEIVRDEAGYFAPQRQTKIMNEGWAVYWHSKIMTQKALDASEIIDYAEQNAVLSSSPGQFNPYKVGVAMFRHIESRWDKGQFGREWDACDDMDARKAWDKQLGLGREKIFQVRKIYNDVTFIDEFFTPAFCEENDFFSFGKNNRSGRMEIDSRRIRKGKVPAVVAVDELWRPVHFGRRRKFRKPTGTASGTWARRRGPKTGPRPGHPQKLWYGCGAARSTLRPGLTASHRFGGTMGSSTQSGPQTDGAARPRFPLGN